MSNPWLKRNQFMSMWLSSANSVSNSARGRVAAEVRRHSTTAANNAVSEMSGIWTKALRATPATKRKRKR